MTEEIKKIGFGLRETPEDKRDFSHEKVFGAISAPLEDFIVANPIMIEDQKETDYCPAEASSSVAEDHEGLDLDPIFSFAAIKSIDKDPQGWGSDLRSACKAACKIGFVEKKDSPYGIDEPRDKIVYLSNWPQDLLGKAAQHKQKSYFRIDEGRDIFESMRRALWQHKNEKCSILTGVVWRAGWTDSKGGIISSEETEQWGGHALKIFGQKMINNHPYLVAQLSNGENIGDKGIFYFPREVINRDFTFGAFMFIDMDPQEAKKKSWSFGRQILESIKSYLESLII